ncbi:MAG: EAL domain-containing protein [Desulfovibrionaceae bacterium]|jgi:EAL domain-containing protein (putative c-di-GMP-specific phosphodiesterase class I)|nr:EAL domain-containing protein [Desulfovibrionaceae bacterium]
MLQTTIDIETVLATGAVTALYQPLVAVRTRRIFGYEALGRGLTVDHGLVSPGVLFELADAADKRLALDRLLRERAFEGFAARHAEDRELVLSVNVETALIGAPAARLEYLARQVLRRGINPNNVVIELVESRVRDVAALGEFIAYYRSQGFLIALDDVGAGHSNLDRVAHMRPDVIKIDRGLISDIDSHFHKLEVARALVTMGRKLGALVVGEGVETAEEARTLLELGVDVLQGFYFSPPVPLGEADEAMAGRIRDLAASYREHVLRRVSEREARLRAWEHVLGKVVGVLRSVPDLDLPAALAGCISRYPEVECFYVLDEDGVQVGDTVCNPYRMAENKRFLYQPARHGDDHSLKRYYLPLRAGLPRFVTEPYVSLASGNLCTTLSCFYDGPNARRILCMDMGLARPPEGDAGLGGMCPG